MIILTRYLRNVASAAKTRLRSFVRNTDGSAAIEFVYIAGPFFAILFSMFEVGISFTADTMLQNAVNEAARKVRTGELQLSGAADKKKAFRDEVCNHLVVIMACDNDLMRLEVRSFSNAANAKCISPTVASGAFRPSFSFQPGGPGDFILVCAYYRWEHITPGLGYALQNTNGGDIIQASAAVRNEPYPTSPAPST